jgi:Uma2 family endonuclease
MLVSQRFAGVIEEGGAMALPLRSRRFTVDEYEHMGAVGIIRADERVELIRGEIVAMSPIGGPHAHCVTRLMELLVHMGLAGVRVMVQNPVRLPDDSEPVPDLMLIRDRDYHEQLPTGADILIVIEVSDSTRTYDRKVKLPLYAEVGIPEAWIADIVAGRIERYTFPNANGYQMTMRSERGGQIESAAIPALTLPVDAILGPPKARGTGAKRSGRRRKAD